LSVSDISSSSLEVIPALTSVQDPQTKTAIYNEWVLYSAQFTFHRSAVETEFFTPSTHVWICGVDKLAIIAKQSELYEANKQTYTPVIDIEYIIELSDDIDSSAHPWSLMDVFIQWKRQQYGYITVNDIGKHVELLKKYDTDNVCRWGDANPFQYYTFNFKCPRIPKEEVYFTIN
jgi:hypothetical protein